MGRDRRRRRVQGGAPASAGAGELVGRAVPAVLVRGYVRDLPQRDPRQQRRRRQGQRQQQARRPRSGPAAGLAGAGEEGRLRCGLPRPRHGDLALQGEAEE